MFICGLFFFCFSNLKTQKISAEDAASEIEKAIYTKQEFFGADANVPLPTVEARENLSKLAESQPDNIPVLVKLAETNEELERFDEAEKVFTKLAEIDGTKFYDLAAFYERRGRYDEQGEVLHKILKTAAPENRAGIFEKLLTTARRHDLKKYLSADFFAETARENADVYGIFVRLIENLEKEKNHTEALNFVRQAKARFPEYASVLLEKEIEILLALDNPREAEAVYQAAFDPFWSEPEADEFYDFLSGQDRLRAYGSEIAARFKANNADFDAAVRLALYRNNDWRGGNDDISPIILKLEKAKKDWTTGELVTATRLLLKNGDGANASRFLYTLYLREDFKKNSDARAKIIYQLFEMFSDAETARLPLTKGDLSFYEDIAQADTHPGITTGILSLIFSDTNPRERFEEQETLANQKFNRAAAYRIFEQYKKENPASPEFAQMYLDIIRLYAAAKEPEIAEKTLNEFAEKYAASKDFADAALKLADAYRFVAREEKAREIYQKILDSLGGQKKFMKPETRAFFAEYFSNDDYQKNYEIAEDTSIDSRNEGINIPNSPKKKRDDYYYYDEPKISFNDYLAREKLEIFYDEILKKLVASLSAEKKTSEILAVYSREIAKYPNEEWLYRERLEWLEKTNLTAEQFEVYKIALARFETDEWRDKLARFFIREKRDAEFAEFSADLTGKLEDTEVQDYLSKFINGKLYSTDFDRQLYLKLYESAHRRFPHNRAFVSGLLNFYRHEKMTDEWRKLAARYYFEFPEIRKMFLDDLASKNELRNYLQHAEKFDNTIYTLFRADVSVRLSNFENAVAAYRTLNELYPHTPEFSEKLISLTRSFGQKNFDTLNQSANYAKTEADFSPSNQNYRTRSGEIFAETGDYEKSNAEWAKLIPSAAGEKEIYLDAATVFWDYFQYAEALETIEKTREKFADASLYAFETGAIYEAKKQENRAVREYVKALGINDEDSRQKERSKNRLVYLSKKTPEIFPAIDAAFAAEKGDENSDYLSLGFAEFLQETKRETQAEKILNQAIAASRDDKFITAARDFYQNSNIYTGEQFALSRLAQISPSPRRKISYNLQLAESFEDAGKRDAARNVLAKLAGNFPTNYGVITETANFYRRLGFENESAQILQNALPKAKGFYKSALAKKLADRLINLNRLDSAEKILTELHAENKADEEIFRQLSRVCIRTGNADLMRKAFTETVAEIKKTDGEPREINDRVAGLRTEMIDAFTRLKDYRSAIDQHIEIINREPDDEELTENAILYVRRYGGADSLLNYYLKLSEEAFKNYRWNVVLARIYAANNDTENAVKNYETAIINQPEMPELYLEVAELETRRKNFDAALKNIDEVLVLTNDAPENLKKKIEILKKAGRAEEAKIEQAKLPAEEKEKTLDRFAEARAAALSEKEKAREIFRQAFVELLENPLKNDLNAADITAYANSVRETDALDSISEKLWMLREKLIEIADRENSTDAGEARKRLSILETAMPDALGATAKNFATDEELVKLHEDWLKKIESFYGKHDTHQSVSLIQDLSRRAGFGDIEEKILKDKIEREVSGLNKRIYARDLVNFYNERGLYDRAFDAIEIYGSDDLPFKAETARVIGNREKELEALRAIYWKLFEKPETVINENVSRYLEILQAENRDELKSLTEKQSAFQLQLINFLIAENERELAHSAIEHSAFSKAWKAARHAEISLALREFADENECYFCDALQFDSIGNLIAQTPDKKRFLINDDWFKLTRRYGEWLREKKISKAEKDLSEADEYLPAMTENFPNSADEQLKLGAFYLEKNEAEKAAEHFKLAIELDNFAIADKRKLSYLAAAYFRSNQTEKAEEICRKVLDEGDEEYEGGRAPVTRSLILFQVLQKYDSGEKVRGKFPPLIVEFLKNSDADKFEDFQNLIRSVAASFKTEAEKTGYFLKILEKRPTDLSLAQMLIDENLVAEPNRFYELLIARSDDLYRHENDYRFQDISNRVWNTEDAEAVYEQENDYSINEPEKEKFYLRRKLLEILLDQKENGRAEKLITETEKVLKGKYARPAWLRAAKINLQIRTGKFDQNEAERFIGISVPDSATKIVAPNVERFNSILEVLKKENAEAESLRLSEAFFARQIALENYDAANFSGLAEAFFRQNKTENALQILRLAIASGDDATRENALREIASIDEIKARMADAAKIENSGIVNFNKVFALNFAAETVLSFGQKNAAIEFRRELQKLAPDEAENKIKLAEILISEGATEEAFSILYSIISDRNALRQERWLARKILREAGAVVEFPDLAFDGFSQYYNGLFAERSGAFDAAFQFFTNAQIAEKDALPDAKQHLIKLYALAEKPFAALKLAANDNSAKPDELLQMLSVSAEKTGDFQTAIEYEKAKSSGGNAERIKNLQKLAEEKNARAIGFKVDLENTESQNREQ